MDERAPAPLTGYVNCATKWRAAPTANQLLVRARQWAIQEQAGSRARRAIRTLIAAARRKLKQAPPSPPALIQQHLIAGEPQFQSCAQMDKPSRVGYGLHRQKPQPAKSARYWAHRPAFARWTFISTWQTSPDLILRRYAPTCLQAALSRSQDQRASAHRGGRMLSSVLPVHHHRPVDPYGAAPDRRSVASGCRRSPLPSIGPQCTKTLLGELVALSAQGAVPDAELRARLEALIAPKQKRKPPSRASLVREGLIDGIRPVRSLLVAIAKLPGRPPASILFEYLAKLQTLYPQRIQKAAS